ncbi:hypothetical protein SAMN06272765_0340 [Streptomyces sp. Ag109_G2-15]|nr:hypothetical protein SAMN06272765_0340 [Streptomyces sp. Ag109_G2-15]
MQDHLAAMKKGAASKGSDKHPKGAERKPRDMPRQKNTAGTHEKARRHHGDPSGGAGPFGGGRYARPAVFCVLRVMESMTTVVNSTAAVIMYFTGSAMDSS